MSEDLEWWRVPEKRGPLPVLYPWGPNGEKWEPNENGGYYALDLHGLEIRCFIDREVTDTLTTTRIEVHDGSAMPTICPGALYSWMLENALLGAKSKQDMAIILGVRLLGSDRVAELMCSKVQ